jgi:hypothetical protein
MKYFSILLFLLVPSMCFTETIGIDYDTDNPIIIDGVITNGEMHKCQFVVIQSADGSPATVYFKHNFEGFYFAFVGLRNLPYYRFPEVLLDLNNDKSADWQTDDWWFHVSATDCENQGEWGDYSVC